MEKPKIVSMKDALNLAEAEGEIPELPSSSAFPAPQIDSSQPKVPSESEPPHDVPPERTIASAAGSSGLQELPQDRLTSLEKPLPSTEASPENSTARSAPVAPSPTEPASAASGEKTADVPLEEKPPSGAPPWVEREPQTPTVAEMAASSVPAYPGVGRPKVQAISQGLPLSDAKPAKLYERPELDAERFAEELTSQNNTPANRDVVKEYRDAASRDILPSQPSPPKPLTIDQERAKARELAAQIHAQNQQMGFVGKLKRMFGLR